MVNGNLCMRHRTICTIQLKVSSVDILLVDGQFCKIVDDAIIGEVRLAQLHNDRLVKYQHQTAERELLAGNIYLGRIIKHYKALDAAFVDIGLERDGFVQGYRDNSKDVSKNTKNKTRIHESLQCFQLVKDARGKKCPTLTQSICLTGRYTILHPSGNPQKSQIQLPNLQVVMRPEVTGVGFREIEKDALYLAKTWDALVKKAKECSQPCLLYKDNDVMINVFRAIPYSTQVVVEGVEIHHALQSVVEEFAPDLHLVLHKQKQSLFQKYHIEDKISALHQQEVKVPSGGSVVINQTEAMIAIDVNSGNSKRDSCQINIDAADVALEQIRLRNLSGLIVIDFIDMHSPDAQVKLCEHVKALAQDDYAQCKVNRIANSGVMEIARQRTAPSIAENIAVVCDKCNGAGMVLAVSCCAVALLRDIRDYLQSNTKKVVKIALKQELLLFIMNNERQYLEFLQKKFKKQIVFTIGDITQIDVM